MSDVALFFLRPWLGAGSTTFTAHLAAGFKSIGHRPTIYRVTDFQQAYAKPFGAYEGIEYRCITAPEAKRIAAAQPSLIAATAQPPHVRDGVAKDLSHAGARPVVHDDAEAALCQWTEADRAICVRRAVLPLVPGSTYLPHPYMRQAAWAEARPRSGAVSTARVAASKRTGLLLEANRLVPEARRIKLLGMEDRLYSKSLQAAYADVYTRAAQGGPAFPMTFDAPVEASQAARYNVDLSWFANDGGGTQYTQLEAMDAGAACVMHADWFRFDGDVKQGVHAIGVGDENALAQLLQSDDVDSAARIAENCAGLLRMHDARAVARAYFNAMLGGKTA